VVHVHSPRADAPALLAWPRGVARVLTNHSSGFLENVRAGRGLWYYKVVGQCVDRILAPSRELATLSAVFGLAAEQVRYIPNGVDTEVFAPDGVLESGLAERLRGGHPVVLATRRLEHKNGVDLLVRAFADIARRWPDCRLVIAGDGPERARLSALSCDSGVADRIHMLGSVPRGVLRGLYARATVCVLPSRMEATSLAGLEAMACGRPLVGTRVGGIPEIIADGVTGMLVDPESPGALAEAITRVLGNREVSGRMGEAARARAMKEFSWQAVCKMVSSVYDEVIREKAGRG
jgi:glycosyltransferase involved in cell wall biosynthesis